MKRAAALVASLAVSGAACAHGSIQGLDHFSGGLLHPLVEPTHLISLVALGLALGQRGIARADGALLAFAAGLLAGLGGAAFAWTFDADLTLLVLAALSGLVVALSLALPALVYVVLAAAFGAGIGMGSNPEALSGSALVSTLAGAGIGANLWLISIAAIVNSFKKAWLAILVRVVGSWTCAASVLVLALWVSGKHPAATGVASPAAAIPLDTTR
jgi:urease accessory protein